MPEPKTQRADNLSNEQSLGHHDTVLDPTSEVAERSRLESTAPRHSCLVQIYGSDLGKCYVLAGRVTIGRDATASIRLDIATASREHARLVEREGRWVVHDLGSTNGTFVNGERVTAQTALDNGDLLKTGRAVFKFLGGGNVEALYHEEIYRLTILDGLTALHNRRYFTDFLEREIARAARYRRPLSIAIFDVDHFKKINDSYGHLSGDHVLQELARLIRNEARREELAARYGGEEFALILPETTLEAAIGVCERVRQGVESEQFVFDGESCRVTVSAGAARLDADMDLESLIKAADAQLYRAKTSGRNRVFPEPGEETLMEVR